MKRKIRKYTKKSTKYFRKKSRKHFRKNKMKKTTKKFRKMKVRGGVLLSMMAAAAQNAAAAKAAVGRAMEAVRGVGVREQLLHEYLWLAQMTYNNVYNAMENNTDDKEAREAVKTFYTKISKGIMPENAANEAMKEAMDLEVKKFAEKVKRGEEVATAAAAKAAMAEQVKAAMAEQVKAAMAERVEALETNAMIMKEDD